MKKAVVLGMILLALGTLAYADASIGFGWGRTTFSIASGSSVSGSDIYSGFGGGTWPPAPRENLDIAYSGDNTAFHFTGYLDGTVLSWVGIYGTLKLMPDMFSVLIGRFDNDGWDDFRKTSPHPLRDVHNGNVGRFSGYGVIGVLAPKDSGFEAAVMYKTGDPTTGSSINTISGVAKNTNVGASYTVPNTVKVVVGSTTGALDPLPVDRNIFGRVEVLMVPNLTLWADVKYDGFDFTPAVSNISAELAAAYDMKPLTIVFVGLYSSVDVAGTKINAWGVVPEVYYNMGAFTLGLYANVSGTDVANSGIAYSVEPYVKLNDFNLRVSVMYSGTTAAAPLNISTWEIPVVIDWGF
jgi:hypothetical protein